MRSLQAMLAKSAAAVEALPVTDVQKKIIFAAETLFASEGLEAASLRKIATMAGQGNTNAVRYHFGTKERLVQSIFEYRLGQMDPARQQMLATLKAEKKLYNVRRLFEVIILPNLALVDDRGQHSYIGFLAQYLLRDRVTGVEHAADRASNVSGAIRETMDLLLARISYVPRPAALSRLALCHLMFLSMVVRRDRSTPPGGIPHVPEDDLEDTLDMMVAAFTAPYKGG
jgi:AcrR family transcriptional regulator